jgi:hypothetical protein
MFKLTFLFLSALLLSKAASAQSDYKRVPFYLSYSIKGTTNHLCKDALNDSMKVRAIYVWITHNIRYDVKAWLKYSEKRYTPGRIMRRRKVVCQGYSDLFISMCKHAGIKALEVAGYDKGIEYKTGQRFYWDEHAWNAVRIDKNWYTLDLTWDSGKIKIRDRTFRKFLFNAFGIPYVENKLCFIPKASEDYYLKPSEYMIKDHLPANPVFQMRNDPVPVNVFEGYKVDTAHSSKKNLDFNSQLDTLQYRTYLEATVHNSERAHGFNKKNNRIIGNAYTTYAGNIIKSLPPKPEVNPGEQFANCQIALKYFKGGINYLGKFRKDNALIHEINMDSIEIRNRIIQTYIRQFQSINRSVSIKDIISLKQLKKRIIGYGQSVTNLSRLYSKKTSDNMQNVQRNIKPDKYKPELIAKWKAGIETNNQKIAILTDTAFHKDENIGNFIDTMQAFSSKANETYLESAPLISKNTQLNINNTPRGLLITNYLMIADLKKRREQHLQTRNSKAIRPMAAKQKERFSSLSKIIRLITDNKKMLVQIKKMSISNEGEDNFYEEENRKLFEVYLKTLAYYNELIVVGNIEHRRMAQELKYIAVEKKLFRKELKIQAMKYIAQTNRENFRFRLFNLRTDLRINFCKQGMKFAEQRLRVLTKVSKK